MEPGTGGQRDGDVAGTGDDGEGDTGPVTESPLDHLTGRDETPSRSGRLLAFGSAALILILIAVSAAGYFFWRPWIASSIRMAIVESLERSGLAESERQEVLEMVEPVLDDLASGDLTREEFTALAESFEASPLSRVYVILVVQATQLGNPELEEEMTARIRRAADRLSRGVIEGKVSGDDLEALKKYFTAESGELELHTRLTRPQLELLLEDVEALVDRTDVPDEDYELHVAEELRRVIAAARKQGGGPGPRAGDDGPRRE